MRARKLTVLIAAVLAAGVLTKASADYVIKDANSITQTVFAYVCSASKICPASVPTNSAGVEIATSSNPLRTDPTGTTTQPVSATALPLPTGAATSANQTTANTSLSTIATNSGTQATAANQTSIIGSKAAGTAATSAALVGGVYNSAGVTLTTGQQASLQFDASGNLKVTGGAGGTSSTFGSAFPSTGTAIGVSDGTNMQALRGDTTSGAWVNLKASSVGAVSGTTTSGTLGQMINCASTTSPSGASTGTQGYVSCDTNGATRVRPSLAGNDVANEPCLTGTKAKVAISQATSTQIITGAASKKTYVCSIAINGADAENISIVEGTGTLCATGIAAVLGGTTAAAGMNLAANGGITLGNGRGTVMMADNAAADNVCILQSGTGRVAGVLTYVQQ